MGTYEPRRFWPYVWRLQGAVTLKVLPRVGVFLVLAALIVVANRRWPLLTLPIGPAEVVGVALGVLLVLRSNAGHERWWEARKLWGGIVNQSRNLASIALAYGPRDAAWREEVIRLVAAWPHVIRQSLRGERDAADLAKVLGEADAARVVAAQHMPSFVAGRVALALRAAADAGALDRFAFLSAEQQRAELVDHLGGCERILRTPLPLVWVIKVRRLVALYLFALPFALAPELGWTALPVQFLVAYAFLGIDQIAVELENPFSVHHLSHLPLDDICATIEANVRAGLSELA